MESGTVSSIKLFPADHTKNDIGKVKKNSGESTILIKDRDISPSQLEANNDYYASLKVMLTWLGYVKGNISKVKPDTIVDGLHKFQQDHNLPITSNINELMVRKVMNVFKTSIATAEELDSIRDLKRNLNQLGFGKILISNKIGPFTKGKIKEFQTFYGLSATGEVTTETLIKIDELLYDSIKLNDYHDSLPVLKKYLNLLGYGPILLTTKFGGKTERAIRSIQRKYKLPVNGLIDNRTEIVIYEAVCLAINKPNRKSRSIKYIKQSLNRIGFGGIEVSKKLGEYAISQIKKFQEFYGLNATGMVDVDTLLKIEEILASPLQLNVQHEDVISLKEKLVDLGYGPIRKTNKFGNLAEEKLKEFQRDQGLPVSGIADKVTLELINEKSRYIVRNTYDHVNFTLEEALKTYLKQQQVKEVDLKEYISDIKLSLDPDLLVKSEMERFQLLDLSRSRTVTLETLQHYFRQKEMFVGHEELILSTAVEYGINEIILISHALLEVEHGFMMPDGIPVDRDGKITYVEIEGNEIVPGMTPETYRWVYNFYGIYDGNDNTLAGRAKKAFDEGWHSMHKAIVEGAQFVKEWYTGDGLATYYKKKWNNVLNNNANNIEFSRRNTRWIYEQLQRIQGIYKQLDSYTLYMEIPVYKSK